MGRQTARELSYRDRKIVEQLSSTHDTLPKVAEKYGISKQRVYEIMSRAKRLGYRVNRPKLLKRYHQIDRCDICRNILNMAKENELVTRRQLAQILNLDSWICNWHLNQLKAAHYLPKTFATIRSDHLVKAIQYYKKSSLSINAVGKRFGYKNFYSLLNYQKQKGIRIEREIKPSSEPEFPKEDQMNAFGP